jgi:uncharacterized protein YbaR (Trm112 family)
LGVGNYSKIESTRNYLELELHQMTKTQRRASPKLLEILVCPVTKTTLRYDATQQELISDKAGLAFPIREGIPIMLVDEARKIKD